MTPSRPARRGQPSMARHNNNNNKRSRSTLDLGAPSYKKKSGVDDDDDSIYSSSSDDQDTPSVHDEDDEHDDDEPLDVKKVRMAREYLQSIQAHDSDSSSSSSDNDDSDSDDHDDMDDEEKTAASISRKLQTKRLKRAGALERDYADSIQASLAALRVKAATASAVANRTAQTAAQAWVNAGHVTLGTGHELTVTGVALSPDDAHAVSTSKDHSVLLWDVATQSRLTTLAPRWNKRQTQQRSSSSNNGAKSNSSSSNTRTAGQALSVACNERYVAIGRCDATVTIYDLRTSVRQQPSSTSSHMDPVHTFTGHKGSVTSLTFANNHTNTLFSASSDRCIRHYNLDQMLYLETLYGHQSAVTGLHCLGGDRPVSVGRDRTTRVWKLAEDSHLIFRGGAKCPALECVSMLKGNSSADEWCVSGAQDGRVSLYHTQRKHAVATVEGVHGSSSDSNVPRPIVSMASIPGSDVVATGSHDGAVRWLKVRTGRAKADRGLEVLPEHVPLHGFVNALCLSRTASFMVAAVGQEHRLGRWNRVVGSKNRVAFCKLQQHGDDSARNDDNDDAIVESNVNHSTAMEDSSDDSDNSN